MGTQEDRAKKKAAWDSFRGWAESQPVKVAHAEFSRLAAQRNYYALEWEMQIAASAKSGISRPSFWGNSDNGSSVDASGGGKTMPYSGLRKGWHQDGGGRTAQRIKNVR